MFRKTSTVLARSLAAAVAMPQLALAETYVIDTKGARASINFRIRQLGISWLNRRFNDFSGTFDHDEKNPGASKVTVNVKTASVDSNHAESDKHLKSKGFFEADKFPQAKFVSTSFTGKGDGTAVLEGDFSMRSITKPLTIDVTHTGHGKDPWGGYRRGFEGTTTLTLADTASRSTSARPVNRPS